MKQRIKLFYTAFLFCSCAVNFISAQGTSRNVVLNLPEVALLDIEPNTTAVTLNFTMPNEAGNPIGLPVTNASKWLNFTSAIATGAPVRTITAQIDQLVPGIRIKMQAGSATGSGSGTLGTSTGQVILGTSPQPLISGIGGGFTGNGTNNGYPITTSLEITDYTKLVKTNNKIITITYTLSN